MIEFFFIFVRELKLLLILNTTVFINGTILEVIPK
jgi:hypothetical protein